MRFTLYRLKSPYGNPEETILETNCRQEMVERVAKLIYTENISASMLRMAEDKSIPETEYTPYEWMLD